MSTPRFREEQPVAWAFHRNTSRWPFNVLDPDEKEGHQLAPKEYLGARYRPLPAPVQPDMTLARAIRSRLSCRRFAGRSLTEQEVGTLLHAAYGVQEQLELEGLEFSMRPVPSGGALYPLEVYLLARDVGGLEEGVYHYAALTHGLEEVGLVPLPPAFLSYLFMGQPYVAAAGAIAVVTAVVHRSLRKYGDRGFRYILFEAGHLAQNLNLMASACGLGTLDLGGFFDQDLATLLRISLEEEVPLYAVAMGHPVEDGKTTRW
jgi:SagB-type dehydrogenase family enzyme